MFRKSTLSLFILVPFLLACARDKKALGPEPETPSNIPSTMPQTDILWPSLANSPWPMAHHDPQLTSRSPHRGPQNGEMEWVSKVRELGRTRTGVIIGTDGTLYYGADGEAYGETVLVALNPDGTEKWRYGIGFVGEIWCTPLLGADETVYIGSLDHNLYAIGHNGTLKWRFDAGAKIYQGINVGLDGTLYFVAEDKSLYAVSPTGSLRWKVVVDAGFQPYWIDAVAISPDGLTLYLPGISNNLYAIDRAGKLKWRFSTNSIVDDLLVDSQGNIYGTIAVSEFSTILFAVNPAGKMRWSKAFPSHLLPTLGLTMDDQGCLYLVSSESSIASVDYSGQLRWEWSKAGYFFDGALVCDKDFSVYCPTSSGHFVSLAMHGLLKWELTTPGVIVYRSPAIDENSRIYFSTGMKGAQIYCVK